LFQVFADWRNSITATLGDGSTPIFWIDGLSGDGKSVLLLQVAHLILRQADNGVMFHLEGTDHIGELLQYASEVVEAGKLILVIVDDLHRVPDQKAFERIIAAFANRGQLRFALLTCGPTPERRAFEKTVRDIRITRFECPHITIEDRKAFSHWFGIDKVTFDGVDPSILVELLFELRAGEPIFAFANSFGDRLRKRKLLDVVTAALAANVFDSMAPIALVEGAKRRASLQELAQTDQFHFELGRQHNVEGFRLVHSRIAWRLFEEWSKGVYQEASPFPFLAEYLAKAISAAPEAEYEYFVGLMTS